MIKSITVTRDNWLLLAANLEPGAVLYMNPCGDLTQRDALAALEAQYQPGRFDAWQHGQALRVSRRRFRYGEVDARASRAMQEWLKRSKNPPLPAEQEAAWRKEVNAAWKVRQDMEKEGFC